MKKIIILLVFVVIASAVSVSAATLKSWDGTTAAVTITESESQKCRNDGILGPGKNTYSLVDSQIISTSILKSSKIVSDLKKKGLTPETYFDTKTPFYLKPLYPAKYRDRIAWDVWIHAQAAKGICIPLINSCLKDPSPNTIGFNEWFVTDRFGSVD